MYLGLFGVIVLVGLLSYSAFRSVTCTDETCFINRAKDCKSAYFENVIATATVGYTVLDNCAVEKQILSLDGSEPQNIKVMFEGSAMECSFDDGSFDSALLSSFTGGISTCKGTLKTLIDLV